MSEGFIPAHGGYEDLLSFQKASLEKGGLRERMTRARLDQRAKPRPQ